MTFTFWGTPEGDVFHPVECMHELLDTVRRHKVNIDGNICTVMVTILVLEVNIFGKNSHPVFFLCPSKGLLMYFPMVTIPMGLEKQGTSIPTIFLFL